MAELAHNRIAYLSPAGASPPLLAVFRALGADLVVCHDDLGTLAVVLQGGVEIVCIEHPNRVSERIYRILRRRSEQQALVLLAVLPTEDRSRRIAALEAGADAVLIGTDSPEEVSAVTRAQLRLRRLRDCAMRDRRVLEQSLDFVDEGILLMNREGRVLHANRSCLRLLDLDPDVLRERSVPQLLNVLGVPRATIDRVMQSEEAFLQNIEVQGLDGVKNLVVDCRRLPEASGDEPRRWLVQFRDASLLHTIDRMQQDFQAWAAHELRSHLSLLTAEVEALEFTDRPLDRSSVSESMRREVENLAASIERRLAEPPRSGDAAAEALEDIPLLTCLESAMTEVEALALVRGQSVRLDLQPPLNELVFRGRVKPLQQILRYVLVEALVQSPDGARITLQPQLLGDDLYFRLSGPAPTEIEGRAGMTPDLLCAQRILRSEGGDLGIGVGPSLGIELRLPLWIPRPVGAAS